MGAKLNKRWAEECLVLAEQAETKDAEGHKQPGVDDGDENGGGNAGEGDFDEEANQVEKWNINVVDLDAYGLVGGQRSGCRLGGVRGAELD